MTECERLIKEGKMDISFLTEETRCDYFVDSNMKKLWALQIDLVKTIESLCNRNGLTCYIFGGACIGAIRHKGCIPWDDDIDVALKREDYNVFIEKAQEELEAPYFLQTPLSDPTFYRPFVVIRNSNGTCISRGDQKLQCNNGILIHIFPLDGYENNFECNLYRKITYYRNLVALLSYNAFSTEKHRLLRRILYASRLFVFPLGIKHYWIKQNQICTRLSKKYKEKIGIQYTHFDNNCWTWNASVFDSVIDAPFEYTTLPIPQGYHEMLSETYGNYMEFPPVDKRGNKHMFEIEPDVPYKEYCHKKYGTIYK